MSNVKRTRGPDKGPRKQYNKRGKRARRYSDFDTNPHYIWAQAVKKRDKYICQECGKSSPTYVRSPEAHHIKSKRTNSELAFDINNGITLCTTCHRLTESYGKRSK